MPSCQCCGIEDQFDRARAEHDLRRYRRRGPLPTTRRLLQALGTRPRTGATVLDIGGGVGVIHHELLGLLRTRSDATIAWSIEIWERAAAQ